LAQVMANLGTGYSAS